MSAPRRLACLFVPLFPLAARLRSEPALGGEPVAVVEGNGGAARVVAASRSARRAGVRAGMTLAQARALLPKLLARGRDRESERAAQEALLEAAGAFSPAVEESGEGLLTLDLGEVVLPEPVVAQPTPSGPFAAAGGPAPAASASAASALASASPSATFAPAAATPASPASASATAPSPSRSPAVAAHRRRLDPAALERDLGRDLIAAAKKAGLPAGVGIAGSKLAARIAAALPASPTVVPHGEEAAFLAPLPLERLDPELELAATLLRWGVRSVGEFAKLPPGDVAARLGEAGRRLHARARGLDAEPLFPRPLPPVFSEGMELEWPLLTLEPFLALAQGALERLAARLAAEGLGCARLEMALRLEPEGHDLRAFPLPAPTRDVTALLRILRVDLEKRPPGAAVAAFAFTAIPDAPRRGQMSFFGPTEISPERLATALAKLLALVGDGRVGSPERVDGHRPERSAVGAWNPPPAPVLRGAAREGRGLLGVRVLRPAVPLEVIVGDATDTSSATSIRNAASAARATNAIHVANAANPAGVVNVAKPAGAVLPRAAATATAFPPPSVAAPPPPAPHRPASLPPHESRPPSPTPGVSAATQPSPPCAIRALPTAPADAPAGLATPAIAGQVRVASGPWHLEEAWWGDAPVAREYWDVELWGGGLYRIYRDAGNDDWFADGVYD